MAAFEKAVSRMKADSRYALFSTLRSAMFAKTKIDFCGLWNLPSFLGLPRRSPAIFTNLIIFLSRKQKRIWLLLKIERLVSLRRHGFRPIGPFRFEVGSWNEAAFLFRFKSFAECEKLCFDFQSHPDSKVYRQKLSQLVTDLTMRVFIPTPVMKSRR
ncbi:MAG: hypothetical protein MK165_21010 [Pirellulaceae bacterium]|nr:hypothetical protein [Pirellulaceae bacterium]